MKEDVAQGKCNINSVLKKNKITEKIMMSQQKAQTVSPSYFYFLIKNTIRDGGDCATLGLFALFLLFTLIKVFTLFTLFPLLTLL